MVKIPLFSLVVPCSPGSQQDEWQIGRVIGKSRFDLSIGPLLKIRDITNGEIIERFPIHVDRLVIAEK